jgi:hypothetical protein
VYQTELAVGGRTWLIICLPTQELLNSSDKYVHTSWWRATPPAVMVV